MPATLYLWLKALHIISLVAWFAGLFYIFRLYVYHIEATATEVKQTLAVMERKLLRIIMNPAMFATLIFGFALAGMQHAFMKQGWFHAKLLLVFILMAYHMYAARVRRQLETGSCKLSSKQARLINEVPTLVLILAVILVVVKPF